MVVTTMMEILWDGELGPAYLARVLWKGLPAKVTFEQRRERREIELTLSVYLVKSGEKSQGLEAEKQTWDVWGTENKPAWMEPSEQCGGVVKGVKEPGKRQIIGDAGLELLRNNLSLVLRTAGSHWRVFVTYFSVEGQWLKKILVGVKRICFAEDK